MLMHLYYVFLLSRDLIISRLKWKTILMELVLEYSQKILQNIEMLSVSLKSELFLSTQVVL